MKDIVPKDAPAKLREAHEMMCDQMLAILEKEEPTVQELKLVAQFLKDNGIEALDVPGSKLARTREAMEDRIINLPDFVGESPPAVRKADPSRPPLEDTWDLPLRATC